MRKVLIIRSPFVFNNLTDVNYKMRLLKIDGTTILKTVTLVPGQCYPIDVKELEYKFQLSNEFTENEWSSPIRIKTIVEKVPKGATVSFHSVLQLSLDVPLSWKIVHHYHQGEIRVLEKLQH